MKNRLHRYDTNRLKKLSNTEAGLKKSVACKKSVYHILLKYILWGYTAELRIILRTFSLYFSL